MTGSADLGDTRFLSIRRMLNFAYIVNRYCLGVLSPRGLKGPNAGTGKKDTR